MKTLTVIIFINPKDNNELFQKLFKQLFPGWWGPGFQSPKVDFGEPQQPYLWLIKTAWLDQGLSGFSKAPAAGPPVLFTPHWRTLPIQEVPHQPVSFLVTSAGNVSARKGSMRGGCRCGYSGELEAKRQGEKEGQEFLIDTLLTIFSVTWYFQCGLCAL